MSEYQEQAIEIVASNFRSYSADDLVRRMKLDDMAVLAVAQTERVLELEAVLRDLREQHGCECDHEEHEEGCPMPIIKRALEEKR